MNEHRKVGEVFKILPMYYCCKLKESTYIFYNIVLSFADLKRRSPRLSNHATIIRFEFSNSSNIGEW